MNPLVDYRSLIKPLAIASATTALLVLSGASSSNPIGAGSACAAGHCCPEPAAVCLISGLAGFDQFYSTQQCS